MIEVRRISEGGALDFEVVIREGEGETRHHVTMSRECANNIHGWRARRKPRRGSAVPAAADDAYLSFARRIRRLDVIRTEFRAPVSPRRRTGGQGSPRGKTRR